ncbi:Lrp/AsnC family transcriptional regulator [Corynebacterium sp. 335C]
MDKLDCDLLTLVLTEPRAGVREYARRLGVARGTAQSRLDKLIAAGVLPSFAPAPDPAQLGHPLAADVHIRLHQADLDAVVARLAAVPQILRADSVAGADDLSCRVVARDHAHLEELCGALLAIPGVERLRTDVVLRHRIPDRVLPLVADLRRSL